MFLLLTPIFSNTSSHRNTSHFRTIHTTGADTGSTTVVLQDGSEITFRETIKIDFKGDAFIYDHEAVLAKREREQERIARDMALFGSYTYDPAENNRLSPVQLADLQRLVNPFK